MLGNPGFQPSRLTRERNPPQLRPMPPTAERFQEANFDFFELFETSHVTSLAGEFCIQKSPGQFLRKFDSDDSRANAQQVHVIMLYSLVRGICIMAQTSPDAGN